MIPQSGFDIKVIVNELKELVNSRIEKFYNTSDGELLIKIYSASKGKGMIRVLRGECIHLSDYNREVVERPSSFTMLMRKYMNGAVIKSVEQPFFERVIIFSIVRSDEVFNIIFELFNKGNIVICDKDMVIINSLRFAKMKDRIIRPGEVYSLPVPRFQELYTDSIEFKRTVKSSACESIVKSLAVDIGLGGRYAEELCSLAEVDKASPPAMLDNSAVKKLFDVFFLIYKSVKHYQNIRPCVIIKEGKLLNFAPFPFKSYSDCEFKVFETFNSACDYYYSNIQKQDLEESVRKDYDGKISKLEDRLSQQEENLDFLKNEGDRLAKLGELVFANYDLINTIIEKVKEANKNNVSWSRIKEAIAVEAEKGSVEAQSIKEIDESSGSITLCIDGSEFDVSLSDTASGLAQELFEKSKKLKSKVSGAVESIEDTKSSINTVEVAGVEEVSTLDKKKAPVDKKWYQKYRWLFTSNGFLLVCGKDATQNEVLVKKVAEDNDLIFHASIAGSPFGILKNGVSAKPEDKLESARFVASYSRAWRDNISTDVFSVYRGQVSKTAPSGEYVSHGSFVIKGEKEYYRGLWPELRIGYDGSGEVIAGPVDLIKRVAERSVLLTPGSIEPGKVSKRLINLFDKRSFTSEEFLHFIPGNCMIELV